MAASTLCLQIPAAEDAQPAEENQHRDITKADISIRTGADGVGDGGHDRQASKHEEADKSPTLCQAAHSSARPNRQISTTVTISARFICWVITLSASAQRPIRSVYRCL
jgi:hypothetical protein